MRRSIKRFNEDLSPKKVNDFLLETFGISIFKFAQVFAYPIEKMIISPRQRCWRKTVVGDIVWTPQDIKKTKEILLKLKGDIIRGMLDIDILFLGRQTLTEEKIVKGNEFKKFFVEFYDPVLKSVLEVEKTINYKGIDINPKSLIAAGWGNLIHESGAKIQWRILADLYNWFWEKLKVYKYYRILEPPDGIESLFPVQYQRHKKNVELKREWFNWRTKLDGITVFQKSRQWSAGPGCLIELDGDASYCKFILDIYAAHKFYVRESEKWPPLIVFPDKSYFSTAF